MQGLRAFDQSGINPTEVLLFSLAFPLVFDPVLTLLASISLKPFDAEDTLTDTTQDWEKQRVLVVENHLLLGAGLQRLLSDKTDLDVIGISPGNQRELVQEIRQIQPDIVFLDKDSYLTDATNLLTFLENFPKLRVIVISANHNLVRIYNKQETRLCRTTDLFDIIWERNFNDQVS